MNRIIPTLILKDGYIVKGKNFKNHEYVGEPINIVKIFNDKKVDEILILDISKKKDFRLIEDISSESTVPINYAGNVDNLKKFLRLQNMGIEKICLSSFFQKNISQISKFINIFGSQSISIIFDVKKIGEEYFFGRLDNLFYKYEEFIKILEKLNKLGIGEILINDINKDGTETGLDEKLIEKTYFYSKSQITYCGGFHSEQELSKLIKKFPQINIGVGSRFIYHNLKKKSVLINYFNTKN